VKGKNLRIKLVLNIFKPTSSGFRLQRQAANLQAMSDDYSELEPRLPIPNRTVKRLSADDSADYPRESRTSSGTHETENPSRASGEGFFVS
jgi:hypothetical protein